MIAFDTKTYLRSHLGPTVEALAGAGIRPNQVTATAILLSLGVGLTVLVFQGERWPLLLVAGILPIRLACNLIDGLLARRHGMQSHLGRMLNELSDVIADSALYLPLATVTGVPALLVVTAVVLALIGEMTGAIAPLIGASRREDGPLAKLPRGFVFGTVALLLGSGVAPGRWLTSVLAITVVLLLATIANRLLGALAEARQ